VYNHFGTDILTIGINSTDYSLTSDNVDEIARIENVASASPYKNVSATVSREGIASSRCYNNCYK
jgi:hypothetical protein